MPFIISKPTTTHPENKKNFRGVLILIFILILIIVAEAVYYFSLQDFKVHKRQITTENIANNSKSNSNNQITGAIKCLDSLKDINGLYSSAKECNQEKDCQIYSGNHISPRPIWARFKYYQSTQDPNQLNLIIEDLKNAITIPTTIQNDFWNCKLMNEMYHSNLFDPEQRGLIMNLCFKSSDNPNLFEEAEKSLENYDTNNINQIYKSISLGQPLSINPQSLLNSSLNYLSIISSERTARHNLQQNEKELKMGQYFFEQGVKKFFKNSYPDLKDTCTLGEASLDLYKTTKNETYKLLAEYIWHQGKVSKLENIDNLFITDIAVCSYFTSSLYKVTNNEQFKKVTDQTIQSLIQNRLDLSGHKALLTNDGCFNQPNNQNTIKSTDENSLIIGLILDN